MDWAFGFAACLLSGMSKRCARGVSQGTQSRDPKGSEHDFSEMNSCHICLARFEDDNNICKGKHVFCGFRNSKHFHFDGGFRTRQAYKYSTQLCNAIARELVFAKPAKPQHCFVLDFFAGTGGVAQACYRLGRLRFIVDTTWDSNYDACSIPFLEAFEDAASR